jgi:uncharacterized membrane protein
MPTPLARFYGGSMTARDPELKKELDATVQARRELGPEYESELIDSFLEKVEHRLDAHVERRVRRELAEQQLDSARPRPRRHEDGNRNRRFGLAGISLVLAIPLSAIAADEAHLAGLLVTWAGLVGVNVAHSLGHLLSGRSARARGRLESTWG